MMETMKSRLKALVDSWDKSKENFADWSACNVMCVNLIDSHIRDLRLLIEDEESSSLYSTKELCGGEIYSYLLHKPHFHNFLYHTNNIYTECHYTLIDKYMSQDRKLTLADYGSLIRHFQMSITSLNLACVCVGWLGDALTMPQEARLLEDEVEDEENSSAKGLTT